MDNIISPSGFNMNFCEGECRSEILLNDRDTLTSYDKNDPESPFRTRLSCCAPIKWSSVEEDCFMMKIVEDRNGTEVNRTLKNVEVTECACVL
ncbi:unnamed protein product [Onchocerca flexuosa]|uniref:TGF_BETA_2 domain-containing protein n=1 Tax=Onchocerca flexuosa TaxID=387005 RepID=A0A183HK08_9BILA|nr:unnamed protein product [Onchocerca flexuosa]